ncbi:unnamed protein product [Rhodiola kirilowii]
MDKFKAKLIGLLRFSGLLRCHKRPKLVIIVEDASNSKHQTGHDLIAENSDLKASWSTSISEMDTNTAPSHIKASLTSIQSQNADHHASSSNSSRNPTEFINHGLILWTQTRQEWVTAGKQSHNRSTQVIEPRLSWDATYDSLLSSDKPFPQAIPLSEMVDFLVDVWEQEGLYD